MPPIYLCDTNVLSELSRREPHPQVIAWASGITSMAVSAVTLEEVFFGLAAKPNARIRGWFEEFLADSCEVLPVTEEIARLSGDLRGRLRQAGHPRTQADMMIAATAQVHRLTLVTRNIRDFDRCGMSLFDPFAGAPAGSGEGSSPD